MMSLEQAKEKVAGTLLKCGIKNRYAFTGLLIAGIMAVMIGSVLLIVSYIVINAVISSAGTISNTYLSAGWTNATSQIVQALGIIAISLVVTGIAIIVYVLIGFGGVGGGGQR